MKFMKTMNLVYKKIYSKKTIDYNKIDPKLSDILFRIYIDLYKSHWLPVENEKVFLFGNKNYSGKAYLIAPQTEKKIDEVIVEKIIAKEKQDKYREIGEPETLVFGLNTHNNADF